MRKTAPLWAHFDIRPSNVDKKTKVGERPVRLVNYTDVYYNQTITSDLELMKATASDEHIERFGVVPGDIIITKDSESPDDIGVPALITQSSQDMVCAYHLTLLRPEAKIADPRFLYRVLESDYAKQHWLVNSYGVTRYSILTGAISRLQVPAYDLATQQHIADYLDRETGEIDAMIAKMDELAGQLEVRKKTAIEREISDSGPTTSLGLVLEGIKDGTHGSFPRVGSEGGRPLLGARNVMRSQVILDGKESFVSVSDAESIVANGYPRRDDVLLVIVGATIGKTALYSFDEAHAFQRSVAFLRTAGSMDPKFLWYQIQTNRFQEEMWLRAKVSAQPGIYLGDVVKIPVTVPSSIREQRRIVNHLDKVTGHIDKMLAKVAELKSLLIERRSALITDVVTGRKEVA